MKMNFIIKKIKKIYKKYIRLIAVNENIKFFYTSRNTVSLFRLKFRYPNNIYRIISNLYAKKEKNRLKFSRAENPKFSIIIPVYNNILLTVKCLKSIREANLVEECEVIIVDDCSNDNTKNIIKNIKNILYIENNVNKGFIESCNNGASISSGEYLVFLNNDTIVDSKWLLELYKTFENFPEAGLVGSKLVYPDGRLQEAGGIIWSDASAWNWLHKSNPDHPFANYLRDVDYVSGASIMIRRSLFTYLGGFDRRYQHSYYEDTDLAMAAQEWIPCIIPNPYLSLLIMRSSCPVKTSKAGAKHYQTINRQIFYDKWKVDLQKHFPNSVEPRRASDRLNKGNILIIDALTPMPDQDSGSIDMLNLIKILIDIGFRVHFVPVSGFSHSKEYTKDLQNWC